MNISLPNSSYEYVTQEISPYNIEPYLDEIDKSLIWFQTECNINIHGRFRTYNKKIKNMYRQLGCFSDEMYECIQSLNEMTPLLRITNHLNDYDDPEFIRTVKTSLKGRPFRDEDRKEDHARNHLFELDVASKLIESGKKLDLSKRADIIIHEEEYIAECKRIMNSTMLLERIEEAVSQIDSDIHEYSGDIFVDITEVIDTLHTVFVTDETGFPFSVVGWSNVKSVCENLSQKIDRIFCNFKKDYISKVEQLVTQKTDKVQNVFLVSRFVGLHLCAIHRMALMGKVTTNVYKKT